MWLRVHHSKLSQLRYGCVPFCKNQRHRSLVFLQSVRTNLQEALKVAAGAGSEAEKMEARIEADVYEAIQHALAK